MPVSAASQLPPFLSLALKDRVERENDAPFALDPSSSSSSSISSHPVTTSYGNINRPIIDARRPPIPDSNPSRPDLSATSTNDWLPYNKVVVDDSSHQLTFTSSLTSLLVPPLNFDMVCSGGGSGGSGVIYRSGHPNERNFPFMSTLNLKTIIYLSSDDIRDNLQGWIDNTHGSVQLLHFRLNVNKEPFAEMNQNIVANALNAILDKRNLPTLVHCNKGKYRVGVITGLIRRFQGWSMTSIFDEYARFAGSDRVADEEFIDMFPLSLVRPNLPYAPDWLSLNHTS